MNKLLLLIFFLASSLSASSSAIEVLSASGLEHSIARVKTIYANAGDYVFYKHVKASDGMLLLADDGVVRFDPEVESSKVVVAVVKSYRSVGVPAQ